MDEKKQPESVYSAERTEITGPHSLRGTIANADSAKSEKTAPGSGPTLTASATASPVDASLPRAALVSTRPVRYSLFADIHADILEYLKRTKYVWLSLVGVAIIFMLAVTVVKGTAERARIAREKRHEETAATVTPENLIARCGPPAEDSTKQMYPVLTRTMSYQARENEKVVFEFSRTAEEKSDWVFLSMKDEGGARSNDTPEAKIAALPCLDSKK